MSSALSAVNVFCSHQWSRLVDQHFWPTESCLCSFRWKWRCLLSPPRLAGGFCKILTSKVYAKQCRYMTQHVIIIGGGWGSRHFRFLRVGYYIICRCSHNIMSKLDRITWLQVWLCLTSIFTCWCPLRRLSPCSQRTLSFIMAVIKDS